MIDRERIKELESLFDEHKDSLKLVEKLVKDRNLPDTFMPVLKENLEQRMMDKTFSLLTRHDNQDLENLKATRIKQLYDGLKKQGFTHKTTLTLICGLDDDIPPGQTMGTAIEDDEVG